MHKIIFFFLFCLIFWVGCYAPSQYTPPTIQPPRPDNSHDLTARQVEPGRTDQEVLFQRLVREIKFYLGTPYKYGGASRSGIDCSGLVMKVFQNSLGLRLPHSTSALAQLGIPLSVRGLQFGDLLFFGTSKSESVGHVGIYLYGTKFVHSSTNRGVVISDFSRESYYRKNFIAARRLVNLW